MGTFYVCYPICLFSLIRSVDAPSLTAQVGTIDYCLFLDADSGPQPRSAVRRHKVQWLWKIRSVVVPSAEHQHVLMSVSCFSAGGPEGLRALCNTKAVIADRFGWLVQTSIPKPIDYPVQPAAQSW